MKKIFIFPLMIAMGQYSHAQIVSADMGDEFKEMAKFSSRQTGFEGIQTYSSGIVNGSQFFSPSWSTGSVTTLSGETIGKNYFFLFDKVRQLLFMKWKDSAVVLLVDGDQIRSFMLNTDREHYFVPTSDYDSSIKGRFFEVLANQDNGYTLLKFIKTKFVKADERDIEKQRLGDIYDAFLDETSYFLSYRKAVPEQILLKEKNIKKVLVRAKPKVDAFFSTHTGLVDETLVTDLVLFLNQ
jgi:hypothetical protein